MNRHSQARLPTEAYLARVCTALKRDLGQRACWPYPGPAKNSSLINKGSTVNVTARSSCCAKRLRQVFSLHILVPAAYSRPVTDGNVA